MVVVAAAGLLLLLSGGGEGWYDGTYHCCHCHLMVGQGRREGWVVFFK
jgi:hypothetical protein